MPTDSGATDIQGAAKRMSALLQSEPVPTEKQETEVQDEQVEEQEANDEVVEATQETPSEEVSDTEEEAKTYKVKVSGEEREVTLDELLRGYMMESDYRNKTSEVSQKRKALEEKAAKIDQQLSDAKLIIEDEIADLESPEMLELKEYDREAYYEKYDKIQAKIKKFEALKEKREEVQREKQREKIGKEQEALLMAFPTWADQSVMQKEFTEIAAGMKAFGYTDQEVDQIIDHRMFVMAKKAAAFDKIQKQNLADKKAKPKTKTMQPGIAKDKSDIQNSETKQLRDRLKKSGNMRDAAKLLRM